MDTPQILRRPAEWCTASPVVPECPQLPEPAGEISPKKSGPQILLLGQQESQASERPQLPMSGSQRATGRGFGDLKTTNMVGPCQTIAFR